MREIEFRGKSKENGQWFFGYLSIYKRYSKKDKQNYQVCYINGGGYLKEGKVVNETVGQYTGLKDKNGKKIFEGDIVKASGFPAIEVIYDKDTCSFKMKVQYIGWFDLLILSLNKTPHLEVIGNIYDNPELLEVKDETTC